MHYAVALPALTGPILHDLLEDRRDRDGDDDAKHAAHLRADKQCDDHDDRMQSDRPARKQRHEDVRFKLLGNEEEY